MSLQGWFDAFEVLSFISAAIVFRGLVLEYGTDLFKVVKFWEPGPHIAEIEVETFKKKRGAVLVVGGIFLELIATGGIAVTSDRIETQHRQEIAEIRVEARWRSLDKEVFLKVLGKKPSGLTIHVWYKREDVEAYLFALQIWNALGDAPEWRGKLQEIQSIPLESGNQDVPSQVTYGSFT